MPDAKTADRGRSPNLLAPSTAGLLCTPLTVTPVAAVVKVVAAVEVAAAALDLLASGEVPTSSLMSLPTRTILHQNIIITSKVITEKYFELTALRSSLTWPPCLKNFKFLPYTPLNYTWPSGLYSFLQAGP